MEQRHVGCPRPYERNAEIVEVGQILIPNYIGNVEPPYSYEHLKSDVFVRDSMVIGNFFYLPSPTLVLMAFFFHLALPP